MKSNSVLIIEDESKVASFIKKGLDAHDFESDIAYDGMMGKKMALSRVYDVIILDINLPHMNGFEVCKEIRKTNQKTPIIMLTAFGNTDDKLTGFEVGADDYLVKPFEFKELLARLRALIKRTQISKQTGNVLKLANLELNAESKTVKRGNKKIDLTAKEFMLLEYLMRNAGRVVSRADIAERIWDITFDTGTNVIDLYIYYLRKKIDKDFAPKLIHTQVGMGYILKEGDD